MRDWNPVCRLGLAGLGSFRLHVRKKNRELAAQRAECAERLAAGRGAVLAARRHFRLLERLKERRLKDWRKGARQELEELASESHLVQWVGHSHAISE